MALVNIDDLDEALYKINIYTCSLPTSKEVVFVLGVSATKVVEIYIEYTLEKD